MTTFFSKDEKNISDFEARLASASDGLNYVSETDAPVTPFFHGPCREVTSGAVIAQAGLPADSEIEEISADSFFEKLTIESEWFGEKEIENAKGFAELQKLLNESLRDVRVFRIGRIQIDIFVAGITPDGNLAGVRTNAVET